MDALLGVWTFLAKRQRTMTTWSRAWIRTPRCLVRNLLRELAPVHRSVRRELQRNPQHVDQDETLRVRFMSQSQNEHSRRYRLEQRRLTPPPVPAVVEVRYVTFQAIYRLHRNRISRRISQTLSQRLRGGSGLVQNTLMHRILPIRKLQ